ncbi:hypothetical protein AC630_21805 [Bradyrhizobium sp. AS23.2]|nr:hypothetical protein AC630_21805 [Bradyrhizobium sp. AS23.2]
MIVRRNGNGPAGHAIVPDQAERAWTGSREIKASFMLRHCERSEAIQNPDAESLWIASLRSQ